MTIPQKFRVGLIAVTLAAGCGGGDGGDVLPDAGQSARTDADPGIADADPIPDAAREPEDTASVVALGASEDVGIVSTVGIPSLEVTPNAVEGVADSDAVVRRIGDEIYILNRNLDNLTILDSQLQLVDQFSLGSGANPYDVAVVGETIYVAGYDTAGVLVLDAADPDAGVVETIDLSSLEPDTEQPNCSALAVHGDTLIAVCQVLGGDFSPTGPGVLALIDTEDHSFETLELANENPSSRLVPVSDSAAVDADFLIATSGSLVPEEFDLANGCLEAVSLDPTPASDGCVLENETIGGYLGRIARVGDTLWTVGSRADYSSFVASYELGASELGEPLTGDGATPTDLALCPEGEIVVTERPFEGAQGLRVFSEGEELTDELLDLGATPAFAHGLICR